MLDNLNELRHFKSAWQYFGVNSLICFGLCFLGFVNWLFFPIFGGVSLLQGLFTWISYKRYRQLQEVVWQDMLNGFERRSLDNLLMRQIISEQENDYD